MERWSLAISDVQDAAGHHLLMTSGPYLVVGIPALALSAITFLVVRFFGSRVGRNRAQRALVTVGWCLLGSGLSLTAIGTLLVTTANDPSFAGVWFVLGGLAGVASIAASPRRDFGRLGRLASNDSGQSAQWKRRVTLSLVLLTLGLVLVYG
jgi:hypothetical protein